MALTLELEPEEEAKFQTWAKQQGAEIQQDASRLVLLPKLDWAMWLSLLSRAMTLIRPVLDEAVKRDLGPETYLLTLQQTMTALLHASAGQPFGFEDLSQRTPLEDAMLLYDLRIVSLGTAAQIAGISQSELIDALGNAGISVFQYTPEEVLAEISAA